MKKLELCPQNFRYGVLHLLYSGLNHKNLPINIGLYLKDKKRRWCSTETNENGEHVENSEEWGYCSGYCPIELGKGKN